MRLKTRALAKFLKNAKAYSDYLPTSTHLLRSSSASWLRVTVNQRRHSMPLACTPSGFVGNETCSATYSYAAPSEQLN